MVPAARHGLLWLALLLRACAWTSQPAASPRRATTIIASTAESELKVSLDVEGLLSTTPAALAESVGAGRAKRTWDALRDGRLPTAEREFKDVGGAVAEAVLARAALARPQDAASVARAIASPCGTVKLLVRLARDGADVEAVLIPHVAARDTRRGGRTTLCVSSQVGCARGCRFCATGALGLTRSLSADEILAQLWHALRLTRQPGPSDGGADGGVDGGVRAALRAMPPLTNVVFMGMGEPLDNLDAVARATRAMTDERGFRLSPARVCVSTVAPSPSRVRAAGARLAAKVGLAWSRPTSGMKLRPRVSLRSGLRGRCTPRSTTRAARSCRPRATTPARCATRSPTCSRGPSGGGTATGCSSSSRSSTA